MLTVSSSLQCFSLQRWLPLYHIFLELPTIDTRATMLLWLQKYVQHNFGLLLQSLTVVRSSVPVKCSYSFRFSSQNAPSYGCADACSLSVKKLPVWYARSLWACLLYGVLRPYWLSQSLAMNKLRSEWTTVHALVWFGDGSPLESLMH